MNKPLIYLDMDGVLTDFEPYARQTGVMQPDGEMRWDDMTHGWWVNMPACDGAYEFYRALKRIGKVKFLTAMVMSPICFSAKAEWITNFSTRGNAAVLDIVITASRNKWELAGEGRILIDDRAANAAAWQAAGGVGIHHRGNYGETFERVRILVTESARKAHLFKGWDIRA